MGEDAVHLPPGIRDRNVERVRPGILAPRSGGIGEVEPVVEFDGLVPTVFAWRPTGLVVAGDAAKLPLAGEEPIARAAQHLARRAERLAGLKIIGRQLERRDLSLRGVAWLEIEEIVVAAEERAPVVVRTEIALGMRAWNDSCARRGWE